MNEPREDDGTSIKWAYVYGSLEVEEYESFDEAVEAAGIASDNGAESLYCVEVIGGRVWSAREVLDLAYQRERENRATQPQPDVPRLFIVLTAPDGKSKAEEWWSNERQATDDRANFWREVLGTDRVSIREVEGD